jgi:hypothetical protein
MVRSGVLPAVLLVTSTVARAQAVDATLRAGVYSDSDRTQVFRSLAAANATLGHFGLAVEEQVDVVSSASTDVRSSPAVDALTSASSRSPKMSDRRFETSLLGRWNDGGGHALGLSAVYATELDYQSLGAGASASWDLAQRNTTLLAGANVAFNRVGSVTDASFSRSLRTLGYSAGIAQVLSQADVLRLRYDGAWLDGYQASPYRSVRFGNWSVTGSAGGIMTFRNTIGPAAGLPELMPQTRLRHAGTLEWLHAFGSSVATAASYRLSYDDWGIAGHTAALELRLGGAAWIGRVGYRFYLQSSASFYQERYLMDPSSYAYYTSDKELGEERGHAGSAEVSWFIARREHGRVGVAIDLRVDALYYQYPDFALLPSRTSAFGEAGLRVQF